MAREKHLAWEIGFKLLPSWMIDYLSLVVFRSSCHIVPVQSMFNANVRDK